MNRTLPPGWAGNDADHHATVGPLGLRVYRGRFYNPFSRRHHRTGPYLWTVTLGATTLATSASAGHPDGDEARHRVILAARIVAMEITQGCDWLDNPPAALTQPEADE